MKEIKNKIFYILVATFTIGIPAETSELKACNNSKSNNDLFSCYIIPDSTQPNNYKTATLLNTKFSDLPSCEEVDDSLKSLSEVALILDQNKPNSVNEIINTDRIPSKTDKSNSNEELNSLMVFTKRLDYSPLTKQYYLNYLNQNEIANGTYNRPTLSVVSQSERNNTYTTTKKLNREQKQNSFYNNFASTVSLEYQFLDIDNFYDAKAMRENAKASYQLFIDNAIKDSLSSVSNYYKIKQSILSGIIYDAQAKASENQVERLKILEKSGLQSLLDISRANITQLAQNVNFTDSKSQLAQNYQTLLYNLGIDSIKSVDANFSKNLVSSACWNKKPLDSINEALQNNATINNLKHNISSSQYSEKSIKGQNFPNLTMGVGYNPILSWGDVNGNGDNQDYTNSKGFDLYLSMDWTLSNFGQTHANSKAQANNTSSLKYELQEQITKVENEVVNSLTEYISSTVNIIDLSKGSRKAAQNYSNALKAYKQGFLDQTDVMAIFTQLTGMTQSLINNLGVRNTAAIQMAKTVQGSGFDNIMFDKILNKFYQK